MMIVNNCTLVWAECSEATFAYGKGITEYRFILLDFLSFFKPYIRTQYMLSVNIIYIVLSWQYYQIPAPQPSWTVLGGFGTTTTSLHIDIHFTWMSRGYPRGIPIRKLFDRSEVEPVWPGPHAVKPTRGCVFVRYWSVLDRDRAESPHRSGLTISTAPCKVVSPRPRATGLIVENGRRPDRMTEWKAVPERTKAVWFFFFLPARQAFTRRANVECGMLMQVSDRLAVHVSPK